MSTPATDDILLLHLNEAIATIRHKEELFQIIARKLRLIFPFEMMGVSIFDEQLLNKRLFFKDYTTINPPEPSLANIAVFTPIAGSPVELLLENPRIQHIELREHLKQYADFEPFQRLLSLGLGYHTNPNLLGRR
jgi:formate hydrogenlyase transcriptional activator